MKSSTLALPTPAGEETVQAVFHRRLAALQSEVEPALETFLAAKRQAAQGALAELAGAVTDLVLAGGKRLRPALVLQSYRALGGDRDEAALPVALGMELLQAYLLIHDDIMDHAELRRGRPTVHARFRDEHRRRGFAGDSAEHGHAMAILAGDLAHGWAVELFLTGRRALGGDGGDLDRCFAALCEEVIGGQFLELRFPLLSGRRDPSASELTQVLQLKSGRYSVERPLELGALLAAADEAVRRTLGRFGKATGEAFQLRDDVLGVFGDETQVGKSAASDLKEGKHTFLIHYALELAAPEDRQRLRQGLGDPDLQAEEAAQLRRILERSGALGRVLARIDDCLAEAHRALAELPLDPPSRGFFAGFLAYLKERER
jgi:geranylgeranyl diphosphate synthase type I